MTDLAGRYRLLRTIGEGGMGVVHEADDLRLGRRVAIKMIRQAGDDPTIRSRFMREARSAAALSHPNACQLHEIDECDGQPFLVMELLSGRTLAARLAEGVVPADEAIDIVLPVLRALGALHGCGLIHRDLKPANIFLTPSGVKLLDFGLARAADTGAAADATAAEITQVGSIAGTLRYMAPEQLAADAIDARADLFAAGVMLHEMLTGRTPFSGGTPLALLQAMLRADAPVLTGFPALAPVLSRALKNDRADRYPNAEAMATALSAARGAAAQVPEPGIRLVVLPFRLLREDAEIDFLEGALPGAITSSLSSLPNLLVRSNLAAAHYGSSADPIRVGADLDVNHVLTGTILRAGSRLRVTCQLIEAPGGRVAWSGTKEVPMGDLFQLQDDISSHIVDSLPIEGARPDHKDVDVPATPRAYELFLRANQIAYDQASWPRARALYEECLAEDENFAPAWTMLGRVHRLIGKYLEEDVESCYAASAAAFARAFRLRPTLSIAHHQFAYLEVEQGYSDRAMIRISTQLRERPNQPELYAALCHVSRYCGLLDVSLNADARARRLDPRVRTSVVNTHLLVADYASMLQAAYGVADTLLAIARFELGAIDEAIEICRAEEMRFAAGTSARLLTSCLIAAFRNDPAAGAMAAELFAMTEWFPDGEFHFYTARLLARSGQTAAAVAALDRAITRGFFPAQVFAGDPWLAAAHEAPAFAAVCARAWDRHRTAIDTFDAVGGYALLGLKRDTRPLR